MSLDIWVWNFPLLLFCFDWQPTFSLSSWKYEKFQTQMTSDMESIMLPYFLKDLILQFYILKIFGWGGYKSISSFLKIFPIFRSFSKISDIMLLFFPKFINTYRKFMGNSPKNELNMDASGNVVWPTVGRTTDRPTNERPLLCLLQMRWPIVDRISDLNRLIDYC